MFNVYVKEEEIKRILFFPLDNQTFFNTWKYNDVAQPLVIAIMAIYLLIANVLLLSILIAIFK